MILLVITHVECYPDYTYSRVCVCAGPAVSSTVCAAPAPAVSSSTYTSKEDEEYKARVDQFLKDLEGVR